MTSDTDTGQQPTDRPPTMGDIRALVADVVDKAIAPLREGGKVQSAAQQHETKHLDRPTEAADSLDTMVSQAIDKVLGERDRKQADDDHAAEHERLRAAAAERTPVDRPRRTRLLGNIFD